MNIPRRRLLGLAGAGAAFLAMAKNVCADSYPIRPIHLVVGFPAGGPNDILARLRGNGFPSGWVNQSSSKTDPAPPATLPPRLSCVRRLTGIRF